MKRGKRGTQKKAQETNFRRGRKPEAGVFSGTVN